MKKQIMKSKKIFIAKRLNQVVCDHSDIGAAAWLIDN